MMPERQEAQSLIILLATDVEIWPRVRLPSETQFREEFKRFILGSTPSGDYGLPFQLRRLKEHDLRGVFLVDALFASAFGLSSLKEIVEMVLEGGQEVQLHIHTEWVERIEGLLPGKRGMNMRDFSLQDQRDLIRAALDNMDRCGVKNLTAFRAGNFGANWETLEALAAEGILYDTSYNIPYIGSTCDLRTDPPMVQPRRFGGIIEFPITFFKQGADRYRHAQIGSCSFAELTRMLDQADRRGWHSFQILSHNFELMNAWSSYIRPNHWPDADMLTIGHLSLGGRPHGPDRMSKLTWPEHTTMMTLWCIARSPLMMGGDLLTSPEQSLSYLKNREVLAVNQRSTDNRQVFRRNDRACWIATDPDTGDRYLALFNLADKEAHVNFRFEHEMLRGTYQIRDLWAHEDLGEFEGSLLRKLPPHGAGLYRLTKKTKS